MSGGQSDAGSIRVVTAIRFQELIVKINAIRWASSFSSKCFAARSYTASGTNPSVSTVTASVSASAACSFAVKNAPASSQALS